ncbi:hypothetical protein RHP74_19425 [Pseudomonas sp. SG20052]|nr:hypothetical protein [Pseudomonas sp. SG20052]WNF58823.1 hypothetical protein RHP74_19425 [Pseudomonas sp. SG20052]
MIANQRGTTNLAQGTTNGTGNTASVDQSGMTQNGDGSAVGQ